MLRLFPLTIFRRLNWGARFVGERQPLCLRCYRREIDNGGTRNSWNHKIFSLFESAIFLFKISQTSSVDHVVRCLVKVTESHFMNINQGSFVYAPSQWDTTLQCYIVSHWLSACTKLFLNSRPAAQISALTFRAYGIAGGGPFSTF